MMEQIEKNYNTYEDLMDLLEKHKKRDKDVDIQAIKEAYEFAKEAHKGQTRRSGTPYILHPVSVACILIEQLGIDTESLVAALLHDTVEDTQSDLQQIEKIFGKNICILIDGLTKLGQIPLSTREEQQAENLRKMFMAMADDIRVILIKLADRLHNMRTLSAMANKKQLEKARETMEVYAPIAHRLGMKAIKEELEDISLQYLDPFAYKEIETYLAMRKNTREAFIEVIKSKILNQLKFIIPDVHIEGRVKSINGIYRKVYGDNRQIEEVYDIFALRVIVNTESECYNVLGHIHEMFHPIPNRFKDYISTPKPNFYRSLHTTVIGREGIPFEVQIRNWEMQHTSEYGIAAHWKYKLGMKKGKDSLENRLAWIRQMIENQMDNNDAMGLLSTVKSDLAASEEVFVFTPQADVICLPVGATIIDFAYAIHSAVGNKMIGAKIDKRIVAIDSKVKTGEIVEIITTKEVGKGPSRDWLKIARTSEARNKIRQWFKKEKKEENIEEGKLEVEREFKRNRIKLPESEMKDFIMSIAKRQRCGTIGQFFEAVGYGGIQLGKIMPRIKEEYLKLQKTAIQEIKMVSGQNEKKNSNKNTVIIDGEIDNCLVKFAKCCNPLPGDKIVGYITRGYGVSIHKASCENAPGNISNSKDSERWLSARWADNLKGEFNSNIEITAKHREGILADIAIKFAEMHVLIQTLGTKNSEEDQVMIFCSINVSSLEHLDFVMGRIKNVRDVISVVRP